MAWLQERLQAILHDERLDVRGLSVESVAAVDAEQTVRAELHVGGQVYPVEFRRPEGGLSFPGNRVLTVLPAGAPENAEHRHLVEILARELERPPTDRPAVLHPDGRVLVVEFVNADQFPGRINYILPLIAGYYATLDVEVSWVRFAVSTTNLMEHGRDAITLDADEEERLVALAAEVEPTFVLSTDAIYAPQIERVLAAGDARHVVLGKDEGVVLYWLGQTRDLEPRYDWIAGNDAARQRRIDNVYMHFAEGCGHPKRVNESPAFRDPAFAVDDSQFGCTFCTTSGSARGGGFGCIWAPNTGIAEWAGRQVTNLLVDSERRARTPNALLFEQHPSGSVLRETITALEQHGAEDVQLLFATRTDVVPALAARVREHFERRPDSTLRFGIYASGVESFSAHELTLFNKATTPTDGVRAVNAMRALSHELPGRFWHTGLSFLLFTPWTTLDNLALNFALIRFLGLTRKESGNIYQARLRLHPELPLRKLVESEGLLDDDVHDSVVVMNRRKLFGAEEPWRCADPRVEPVMSAVLRFDLIDSDHADELTTTIGAALREVLPGWNHGDDRALQEFALAMIHVARSTDAPLNEQVLVARARDLWRERRARRAERATRAPMRVGEARVELAWLLDRVARLVRDGVRRVCTVAVPNARDPDREVAVAVAASGLAIRWEGCAEDTTLVVAASAEDAERYSALMDTVRESPKDTGAVAQLAELLGIPVCCASGFPDHEGPLAWRAYARRTEEAGAIPHGLLPVWVPSISFVPCRADCDSATATYDRWFDAMGVDRPTASTAWVISTDHPGDGDLVTLAVTGADDAAVTYDGPTVRGSDPVLVDRLSRGDGLRLFPGQLRVVRDGGVFDVLGPGHVLWSPASSYDGEFWQELARAARLLATTSGLGAMYVVPFGEEGRTLENQGEETTENGESDGSDGDGRPTLSPFEASIEETLMALVDGNPVGRGVVVLQVGVTGEPDTVAIDITMDGERYELRFDYGNPEARCFFRAGRFAVSHQNSTPLTSRDHQQRVKELATALDRTLPADPG